MLLSAVTTPVRALVQTGEPPNLAREGDPIGLAAEAGGFARPNHGLTTVVTVHGLRYPVEISENSRSFRMNPPLVLLACSAQKEDKRVRNRKTAFSHQSARNGFLTRMALGLGVRSYDLTSYDSLFFNYYQQIYVYNISNMPQKREV